MKNSVLSLPRVRRLGAVLALLVGSAAVIATSPPETWHVSAWFAVDPLELRASSPKVERRLRLTVTLPEPSEQVILGGLNVTVLAHWRPEEWGATSGKPWLRARLFRQSDGSELEVASEVLILDQAEVRQSLSLHSAAFSRLCQRETRCEGLFRVELERQAEPLGGVVTVEWRATADIRGKEDELDPPPGIAVTLTEP
jgi:hypothetical protein